MINIEFLNVKIYILKKIKLFSRSISFKPKVHEYCGTWATWALVCQIINVILNFNLSSEF